MAGYGSDDGFADWAAAGGYTVPDGTVAAARQRGSDYIDGLYDYEFPGVPTGGVDQERSWPRTGATDRYGAVIASDAIPARVVNASYLATLLELHSPGQLAAVTSAAGVVKREKVGPIETEYAVGSGDTVVDATPVSTAIRGMLAPVLVQPLPAVFVV